ncbi:MAG: UbiA family prenyltransferase, partial [Prevotella sp.]|nr:UbiA family prenyltransferase [Prevotella sp.]
MMKPIIKLLRPQQWIKNSFVLLPLFFNGSLFNMQLLLAAMTMAFAFCLASSGIYCLNDICDAESDGLHPKKKSRPIACGAVSKRIALLLMAFCIFSSIFVIYIFPWQTGVD